MCHPAFPPFLSFPVQYMMCTEGKVSIVGSLCRQQTFRACVYCFQIVVGGAYIEILKNDCNSIYNLLFTAGEGKKDKKEDDDEKMETEKSGK